ncbi:DUF3093 domain-containing protein [Brevibacterium jeotgali]|uniref:DUF3093 domain-containing protein n=1 Tax=Brevibacterium jeotgali TaxID=1262550 RepID=A0A2H1L6T9_9MICO|nr:DUF3093 domain-containing protein [Brevibacterium jeotgali]TWC02682.1 DUF3093 family protein [Brevibacterium jeotgali]SMY12592.1 Protein of unknown function (DUF3093) [Brevibacterium jeotgali]
MTATSTTVYSERLSPSAGWWIALMLLSAMTSLLALPISQVGAVVLPLLVAAGVIVWMRSLSARVVVTEDSLVAGPARIERSFISDVTGFDASGSFAQRGHLLDVRAFLMLRPWVKTVVRIEIADPSDPTPYWLVSTRHPQSLAALLSPSPRTV